MLPPFVLEFTPSTISLPTQTENEIVRMNRKIIFTMFRLPQKFLKQKKENDVGNVEAKYHSNTTKQ